MVTTYIAHIYFNVICEIMTSFSWKQYDIMEFSYD